MPGIARSEDVDALAARIAEEFVTVREDELTLKAPLASPALTGTPTVPTAAPGTNGSQAASTAFVQTALAALIDAAPGALDTLNELAAALNDDPNFAATVAASLATKITSFADPNADRIVFWDDSAGAYAALAPGTGLAISGTTIAVATASDTVSGIVELATTSEATTGTDTARAVTPAGLAARTPDASTSAKGLAELATNAEAVAGSSSSLVVTPAGLAAKFVIDPSDESTYPDGTIFFYTS